MEFLLTAEAFPAERALKLGLLNEIVPADELLDRAFEWAGRIPPTVRWRCGRRRRG